MRKEELEQILGLVREANKVNDALLAEHDPTDPLLTARQRDTRLLDGIEIGIRVAMDDKDPFIQGLQEQGAERFMRQRVAERRKNVSAAVRHGFGVKEAKRRFDI